MKVNTKFKKKIQNWITKHHGAIHVVFQAIITTVVFVIYPKFETFVLVVLWLDFSILFHILFVFEVPILFITSSALLTFRILHLIYYQNFSGALLLLILIITFWGLGRLSKKISFVDSAIQEFNLNEKTLSDHLKEISWIGSLALQADFCLLMASFTLIFDPSIVFSMSDGEWVFFLPLTILGSITLLFATNIEFLICVCFNHPYGFTLLNHLFRTTRRGVSLLAFTGVTYVGYNDYATGGICNPNLSLPGVKSMQIEALGANTASAEGVKLLRQFQALGGTNPPCFQGTKMADLAVLKMLIAKAQLDELKFKEFYQQNLNELSEKFNYNDKLSSEENQKRFLETISPPDVTSDSPHDRVQVGIRPSEDPFSKKKKG